MERFLPAEGFSPSVRSFKLDLWPWPWLELAQGFPRAGQFEKLGILQGEGLGAERKPAVSSLGGTCSASGGS